MIDLTATSNEYVVYSEYGFKELKYNFVWQK